MLVSACGYRARTCALLAFALSGLLQVRAQPLPVDSILADMTACSEDKPHGLYADWADCPRRGWANTPSPEWTAVIPWGVVYESRDTNPAVNTRVQLRNIGAYYLSKADGRWHTWAHTFDVQGNAYREDFAGDVSRPADVRSEPDGSVSVRAGDGHNFHFWTSSGRAVMNPADIAGTLMACEARLIVDSSARPDDRSIARFVVSVGGDYWRSLTAQWASDWSNNGDIGIGRFKRVTAHWRWFTMHTCTEQQLLDTPPPVSLTSVEVARRDDRPTTPSDQPYASTRRAVDIRGRVVTGYTADSPRIARLAARGFAVVVW